MTNFDIGDKKQDRIRKSEYALFYSSFFRKSQAPSENRFAAILNRKSQVWPGFVPTTQYRLRRVVYSLDIYGLRHHRGPWTEAFLRQLTETGHTWHWPSVWFKL